MTAKDVPLHAKCSASIIIAWMRAKSQRIFETRALRAVMILHIFTTQ